MRDVRSTDYEFTLKPSCFGGFVLMFRDAEPMNTAGDWRLGKWRKATWKDMVLFNREKLK